MQMCEGVLGSAENQEEGALRPDPSDTNRKCTKRKIKQAINVHYSYLIKFFKDLFLT